MLGDIAQILYTEEEIAERVAELGAAITSDYYECSQAGDPIICICVLRGAAIFMSDLTRRIDLPIQMDHMAVSSYGTAAKSSGTVRIQKDLSDSIEGAHVIIAEDIIDSGLTLSYLRKDLMSRGPKSVEVAALLYKDREGGASRDLARYIGFVCPDEFIVGYGLDYAERYRNLPYIGVLKPEIYQ